MRLGLLPMSRMRPERAVTETNQAENDTEQSERDPCEKRSFETEDPRRTPR